MLYAGTDPESYITKSAFVDEDHRALRGWQWQIRGLRLPLLATHPPFPGRAFAVKVEGKRLSVSPFSGFDVYHHFRNDAFYDL